MSNEEIVEAVFKAIALANELNVQYAVDNVSEFAEDLYSAVHNNDDE